jgi:hypothetical protein
MVGDGAAPAMTPDAVQSMLDQLSFSPDVHEVDRVLEYTGDVLDALEAAYSEHVSTWQPKRRALAHRAIHQAFDAVNNAILALVVDHDVDGAVERLTDALPVIRRAWVVQILKVV